MSRCVKVRPTVLASTHKNGHQIQLPWGKTVMASVPQLPRGKTVMASVHISLSACSIVSSVRRMRRRTASRTIANQQLTTWHACVYCMCRHGQKQLDMDKSGNSNNSKKSVCLAPANSSKIRLAPPKTVDWAIGTLEGCKRKRCCGVALDADVYFHTAHEYFKAFTKCREAKAHSDAKLKLHEQRKIELVEKVCMLQAAFSHIAQEKEALRAENVLSGSENVKLRSQLHEQQGLSVRLEAKVQELADDMRDLQKQVRELHVRCADFQEEVEVKEVEINKLRSSLEQKQCKQLAAVVEQKNQQSVVRQDVREPALLASKRRSEERDEDGEITIIGTAKRSKSSETTPVTAAAAAPPLNSSNSATIDQPQMPL
ncbi:hypothetical protein GPALN_011733 [Globodera pallida]|nr:hypothetical protein GPALN_011733 [Globodera pallida]